MLAIELSEILNEKARIYAHKKKADDLYCMAFAKLSADFFSVLLILKLEHEDAFNTVQKRLEEETQ